MKIVITKRIKIALTHKKTTLYVKLDKSEKQ